MRILGHILSHQVSDAQQSNDNSVDTKKTWEQNQGRLKRGQPLLQQESSTPTLKKFMNKERVPQEQNWCISEMSVKGKLGDPLCPQQSHEHKGIGSWFTRAVLQQSHPACYHMLPWKQKKSWVSMVPSVHSTLDQVNSFQRFFFCEKFI